MSASGMITLCAVVFSLGLWTTVGVAQYTEVLPKGKEAKTLIKECQSTLPRNVQCVIVAVPETEIEEG